MPYIQSYADADEFLHTRGRRVDRKKVANNTYAERRGARIAIRLHATDVVTYAEDVITMNTGGWYTVTTKDRINAFLPSGWRIASEKGTWYLHKLPWGGSRWRFTDGLSLVRRGVGDWHPDPRTMLPDEEEHRQDRHNASVKRLISRYLKGWSGGTDDMGSCILCRITAEHLDGNGRRQVVTIGDSMEDTQHLVEHMTEGVYPHSLLYAAVANRGYRDPWVILEHGSQDSVKRALRAYLGERLLVGATAANTGRRPLAVGA